MTVKVTLGLCLRNSEKKVGTALDSIVTQDFPHEMMKLVVVDDGCTDKTMSIVKRFVLKIDVETILLCSGGKGLGASRQMVVDNAEGDYIVWIDDDLVLAKDFVSSHVEFMEKNTHVGAAAAMAIPSYATLLTMLDTACFLLADQIVSHVGTGGAIYRLKALIGVRGFDTRIRGAGEDWDVSHRMKVSGWTLATNKSAVLHEMHQPSTPRALWKRHFWYGYGNHLLYHKFKDKNFLLDYFPPRAFLGGVMMSCVIYRILHKKTVFLIPFHSVFISMAVSFGFIRSQIAGYGHT